jgi:hypothetical protein
MLELLIRPISDNILVDPAAERHEAKVQAELNAQHLELRRQAKGTFEAIKGRRGASGEEYWQEVVAKAKLDYDSGNFLIGRMGACRQLDLPLVATLLLVRKELLDGIDNPTVGDRMLADSAVMAYRNLLRIQGWIGSLCLVVERELFGQRSLDAVLGSTEAAEVNVQVERLEQILLPALDRCHRMLIRALDRLEARKSGKPSASISIGNAGQVNLASNVQNLNA